MIIITKCVKLNNRWLGYDRAYQKIIMPFLEPIIDPSERNKDEVEQTIHIWNILWPLGMKKNQQTN